jgi:hypothetical protein
VDEKFAAHRLYPLELKYGAQLTVFPVGFSFFQKRPNALFNILGGKQVPAVDLF